VSIDVLTPDLLVYDLKTAASPAMAPDGSAIAFALMSIDRESGTPRSHLWLVDPDASNLRQLTTIGTTNGNPAWSPDSATIAFVSHGESEERYSVRLIAVGGGESRILAEHDQGPGALAWSPDGSRIAYSVGIDHAEDDSSDPASPPKPRVVKSIQYKEDLRGVQNRIRSQVFILDLAGSEPRQVTAIERDHADPQWSPDGTKLAVKVVESILFYQRLGIVDAESGDVSLATDPGWSVGSFRWTQDGSSILFDGGPDGLIQSDWFRFDVATGTVSQLTDDLAYVPEGGFAGFMPPAQPVWLTERVALTHGIREGRSGLWTVNASTGEIDEVARFESVNSGLSADAGGTLIAQSYSDPEATGEISVYDTRTGELRVVTGFNSGVLSSGAVGRTEVLRATSLGESIEAWVTYPPGFDTSKRYPVVLEVHGGPYGYFGHSFNHVAQAIAAAGMIVVSSNPRGSTSYGREFAMMVNCDTGGGDWADVQAALDAVLANHYADSARTAIFGYSYGGYMTSWAIGQTDRFQAAVCGAPVFDLESFYGTSDIAHVLSPMLWGGTPADRREWIFQQSPSTHIYNAVTPTLIICGESDVRCPIGQAEQMFAAMYNLGIDVEFVRYPNSNHMFPYGGHPSYKVDYYSRVRDWLASHLEADGVPGSCVPEQGET